MDILWGAKDKLRFIERFYLSASAPFVETKRKIDTGEAPFEPPPFDPDYDDTDPPFLSEWSDAEDSVNLIGQAALCLVQSTLKQYLDGFIRLCQHEPPAGKGNWFKRYKTFFLESLGVDWDHSPVPLAEIEEVNLVRDDAQHSGMAHGMTRYLSENYQSRFPEGLFAYPFDKEVDRNHGNPFLPIYVTQDNLREAIQRIETFCEFLDQYRC